MWKCSIHPAFEEILVLRAFLQKEISYLFRTNVT